MQFIAGAFNLRHDAPTRDLTERPRPLTTVVPTTWFEAGVGLLGFDKIGQHRDAAAGHGVVIGPPERLPADHAVAA